MAVPRRQKAAIVRSESGKRIFLCEIFKYPITNGAGKCEVCRVLQKVGIRGVGDLTQIKRAVAEKKKKDRQQSVRWQTETESKQRD